MGDATMSGFLSVFNSAVVLGWVGFAITGLILNTTWAVMVAVIVALVTLLRARSAFIRGFLAVMEPVGLVLSLLALRQILTAVGVSVQPFASSEILLFLLTYLAFLSAAMGIVPVNMYRLGYDPKSVGLMVLALCTYGFVTGALFVPLLAVLGQIAWLWGKDSSNFFDHILHATLVPVSLVVLLLRLF
jgi:hypothetical protein